MEASIEQKEIRGISLKTVYSVIIATGLIVSTVLISSAKVAATQADIKSEINLIRTASEGERKLMDLRLSIMERRLDLIDAQIKEFKK